MFEVLETVKDLCVNFIFQHISDLEKAKDVCLEFVSDFIFNRLTQEIKIEEQISNGAGTWHISMQAHVPNKYVRDKKSRSKLIGRLRDDIREAIVE